MRFPGSDRMSDALRPPVRRFILGVDVLFELDLGGTAKETLAAATGWLGERGSA
jgi:3,4-dihydroxy 2-butanone 4-phosphate synthase/GTP cyclohydrolase II